MGDVVEVGLTVGIDKLGELSTVDSVESSDPKLSPTSMTIDG